MSYQYRQSLPDTPLDIVGDVHGEFAAFQSLLHRLGYRDDGVHPRGRRLVVVGDWCDRGPDPRDSSVVAARGGVTPVSGTYMRGFYYPAHGAAHPGTVV
ncbi:MAG: metallophosphoesterase, partial [Neisseria elongata]